MSRSLLNRPDARNRRGMCRLCSRDGQNLTVNIFAVKNNLKLPNMVTKKDFMEFAIGRADHEHAELSEAWKLLDTKSQATTATAGVFIAAAFAFVRNTALDLNCIEKILLCLTVTALVISIIYAIRSMRIREVAMPLTGLEALNDVTAIFEKHTPPESLDERYIGLLGDSIKRWTVVNTKLHKDIAHKALLIKCSHRSLLVASLLILLLTGIALLHT